MPVELSPTVVARALARLGEHDLEAPGDVEGALELIAGREDDEAPLEISRYDLQLFLWYQLPCKLLAPPEVKREVAARLGRFLEFAGAGAEAYADTCTSEQTMAMLQAWEAEDSAAGELLREALEDSGLEPPDTDVLAWRPVMGFEEARLRDQATRELEAWIEGEGIDPGARGFKRRQAGLVSEFLRRPQPELDGRAPLDVVVEERLEDWARDGSKAWREIAAPVVPELRAPPAQGAEPSSGDLMRPMAWLLEEGAAGIGLTQTGALNRAFVRAFVERFPAMWQAGTWGPPHREDEVAPLRELHDLSRRARLLRRRGRNLVLTKRGESLLGDPLAFRNAVAPNLIAADGFAGAVQELAVAALLGGGPSVDRDELEVRVHAAIVADGWNAAGESPDRYEVSACAWGAIRLAEALELVVYDHEYDREARRSRGTFTVTPGGQEALRLALRARAAG
ncbi:MAG: hypothetical protein JJE35_01170 [Thermoleophilia bacterium]|nr:hypothetical protein [Thermoleophilia bacterium]